MSNNSLPSVIRETLRSAAVGNGWTVEHVSGVAVVFTRGESTVFVRLTDSARSVSSAHRYDVPVSDPVHSHRIAVESLSPRDAGKRETVLEWLTARPASTENFAPCVACGDVASTVTGGTCPPCDTALEDVVEAPVSAEAAEPFRFENSCLSIPGYETGECPACDAEAAETRSASAPVSEYPVPGTDIPLLPAANALNALPDPSFLSGERVRFTPVFLPWGGDGSGSGVVVGNSYDDTVTVLSDDDAERVRNGAPVATALTVLPLSVWDVERSGLHAFLPSPVVEFRAGERVELFLTSWDDAPKYSATVVAEAPHGDDVNRTVRVVVDGFPARVVEWLSELATNAREYAETLETLETVNHGTPVPNTSPYDVVAYEYRTAPCGVRVPVNYGTGNDVDYAELYSDGSAAGTWSVVIPGTGEIIGSVTVRGYGAGGDDGYIHVRYSASYGFDSDAVVLTEPNVYLPSRHRVELSESFSTLSDAVRALTLHGERTWNDTVPGAELLEYASGSVSFGEYDGDADTAPRNFTGADVSYSSVSGSVWFRGSYGSSAYMTAERVARRMSDADYDGDTFFMELPSTVHGDYVGSLVNRSNYEWLTRTFPGAFISTEDTLGARTLWVNLRDRVPAAVVDYVAAVEEDGEPWNTDTYYEMESSLRFESLSDVENSVWNSLEDRYVVTDDAESRERFETWTAENVLHGEDNWENVNGGVEFLSSRTDDIADEYAAHANILPIVDGHDDGAHASCDADTCSYAHRWNVSGVIRTCTYCGERETYWDDTEYPYNECDGRGDDDGGDDGDDDGDDDDTVTASDADVSAALSLLRPFTVELSSRGDDGNGPDTVTVGAASAASAMSSVCDALSAPLSIVRAVTDDTTGKRYDVRNGNPVLSSGSVSVTHGTGVVEVFDADAYRALVPTADVVTDGASGRMWDDAVSTAWTPAPGGRSPFEYDDADDDGSNLAEDEYIRRDPSGTFARNAAALRAAGDDGR